MPIELIGLLEDVEAYEGKNGFGANVTISTKVEKKTKRVTFRVSDKQIAKKLEELLDTDVIIKIALEQNSFGMRFGEVISVGA